MAGLIQEIREDIAAILTDDGDFAKSDVIFSVTNGQTVVSKTCNALVVNHNLVVDEYGVHINGKTSRVTVSEVTLKALGYPTRTSTNKISMTGHLVTWDDETSGLQLSFRIKEQFPNYQTGLIRCTLEDYGMATPPGRTIIGWIGTKVRFEVVAEPNDDTQELNNGDEIPVQYAANDDGTLTIPYMVGYGVGTPFMLNSNPSQDETYDITTGTFDNTSNGGSFRVGDKGEFNASVPVWA